MAKVKDTTPEQRAQRRVAQFTGLMWHILTYVIVIGFLWLIAPAAALWVAAPWGVAIAFHIASYFLDIDGFQRRRYQKFLAQEEQKNA